MTMSKDLFLSILSMDAYNRGYSPGITGLSSSGAIGNATITFESDTAPNTEGVNASFYGLAYKLTGSVGTPGNLIATGTTIISCRETDQPV